MRLGRALLDSFAAFCDHFDIGLFPHQREDFGEAGRRDDGRFVHRLFGISWPRGDGKSYGAAGFGTWRLVAGRPPQDILGVALDVDGAGVVLDHAKRIVRSHPDLARAIEIRANALLVPATGSRWTIGSREHTNTRGRHPDLVIFDEAGWVLNDELFSSLLAGQASVDDPLTVVISTVGRRQSGPLWTIKQLAEGGDPSVGWRWHSENRSPKVTAAFLERQRRILMPGQFAREHKNTWTDATDAFTAADDVDAAQGTGWSEQTERQPGQTYHYFCDIGMVHDPTVIAMGHEEHGLVYIDKIVTFQGCREYPVNLSSVEQTLRELASLFPPAKIRVESWQGISAVQSLSRLGLPVEVFHPTAKAHAEEWPVLAQRLANRTLVLPRHARLREELLNLVYEVGAQGIRVIDRGKVHQDHAVAVRGVCASLQPKRGGMVVVNVFTGQMISGTDSEGAVWKDGNVVFDPKAPAYVPPGRPPGRPVPTVLIQAPGGGYVVINESDFDASRHELWRDDAPQPAAQATIVRSLSR